jgi:hypothetical protein
MEKLNFVVRRWDVTKASQQNPNYLVIVEVAIQTIPAQFVGRLLLQSVSLTQLLI